MNTFQDHEELSPLSLGPVPPPFSAPKHPLFGMSIFLGIVGAGLVLLGIMAYTTARLTSEAPWHDALIVLGDTAPWDGMTEVWIRELSTPSPESVPPLWQDVMEKLGSSEQERQLVEKLQAGQGEQLIGVDLPASDFEPLLASGRLPEAGKPEVLAGDLSSDDPFDLDGTRFEVVGRIKQGVSGFLYAYALPDAPAFASIFQDSSDAKRGWLDPDAVAHLQDLAPEEARKVMPDETDVLGGLVRVSPAISYGILFGLALVILGSSGIHILMFRHWARSQVGGLGSLFRETVRRPRLFIAHHVFFFGVFLFMGLVGVSEPVANMHIMNLIRDIFLKGDLKYVGDAYASGSVIRAALATFANNYIWQTLVGTLAISIVVPFAGLAKNFASFTFAGFGMAPIWASTLTILPFHSITIAIELEAYIVACFAVTVWPILVLRAALRRDPRDVVRGLMVMSGAVLLSGLMLAVAGLYEALTLIALK